MAVSIETYRMRIGSFRHSCSPKPIKTQFVKIKKGRKINFRLFIFTALLASLSLYICDPCDNKNTKHHGLTENTRTIHGDLSSENLASSHKFIGKRPYPCDVCEYNQCMNNAMKNHTVARHMGCIALLCNCCGENTGIRHELSIHGESRHMGCNALPCVTCDQCGDNNTTSRHKTKTHIRTAHDGPAITNYRYSLTVNINFEARYKFGNRNRNWHILTKGQGISQTKSVK